MNLSFSLTSALLALSLLLPAPAHANQLKHAVDALYSSHFVLTPKGVPEVTVGLMDGQQQVSFSCKYGGKARLYQATTSSSTLRLVARRRYTVRIQNAKPAVIRYWLTAFRLPYDALQHWNRYAATWKKRGINIHPRKIGTLFAINGRLLDNRMQLAVIGFFTSRAKAQQEATRLFTRYGNPIRIHEQLQRPPSATLSLTRPNKSAQSLISISCTRGNVRVYDVEYGRGYRWHGFQHRNFYGSILLTPDRNGKLAVVNRIPLPQLLRGLLPAEMPAAAPLEALKAQSVCARNEILAKIGERHHASPYLFCAHTHCQVYAGANSSRRRTDLAIRQTRGHVLMLSSSRIADTPYSAVCGGHTEHNENVWYAPPNPSLRGKADLPYSLNRPIQQSNIRQWLSNPPPAYCQTRKTRRKFRWIRRYSSTQLNRMVHKHYPIGPILGLKAIKRGVSGRIHALRIRSARKQIVVHGELHIRKILGGLFSSMFTIQTKGRPNPTQWLFFGGGWGHGVGLCQYGAIGRAHAKQNFRSILNHYFTKTKLVRLY